MAAAVFANLCPYCYTYTDLVTAKQSERQAAYQKIKGEFGTSNMVAIIVPAGDYESEGKILAELDSCPEVDSTQGLANIEAMDGYCLEDKLTARSSVKGRVRVNGVVKGEVHSTVSGIMNAVVNVGGIVGRTDGFVSGCINQGAVYGRKDVGGIAGQAEPTDYETLIALENAPKR